MNLAHSKRISCSGSVESGDRPQYEISHPGFLAEPDQGVVLRDFVAALFQPPVEL